MQNKLNPVLVGVAGEYLVAGELSLRGYIASITLRNSRGIDIIASNSEGTKSVSIQVKTNSSGGGKWILNQNAETYFSPNHYYIFVSLEKVGLRPKFYVVPSKVVADYVKSSHAEWLSAKQSNGKPRKDSKIRNFHDLENKYLEAWNLIKL